MLMASRLVYGMAKRRVLPPALGKVLHGRRTPWVAILFTTGIALALSAWVTMTSDADSVVELLGGTTALLLLGVFTVTNVAVLVLRREPTPEDGFRAPTALPVVAAVCTLFLVGPWTGRDMEQYQIAGVLLLFGLLLWGVTALVNRRLGVTLVPMEEADDMSSHGPVN